MPPQQRVMPRVIEKLGDKIENVDAYHCFTLDLPALKEGGGVEAGGRVTFFASLLGSASSDKLLEVFAEKLAETFVQGELYIGDWSTEKGAEIKLTLGPSSKKPLHIHLVEISSYEAAAYATGVFLEIALQAQSRKCRLHPTEFPSPSAAVLDPSRNSDVIKSSASRAPARPASPVSIEKQAHEIKALKTELDKRRRMVSPPETSANKNATPRPLKGASLANPNKKARKYQAIEFESDEE